MFINIENNSIIIPPRPRPTCAGDQVEDPASAEPEFVCNPVGVISGIMLTSYFSQFALTPRHDEEQIN